MSGRRMIPSVAVARAVVAVAALAFAATSAHAADAPAWAADAPPDTALHGFLGTLSDSTDRYFGMSASPLDTAGLEESQGEEQGPGGDRARFGYAPSFAFSRVDGSTFGGSVHLDGPHRLGRLEASLGYAVSSKRWLGGGSYRGRRARGEGIWILAADGGRALANLNRDYREQVLDGARALGTGSDRAHYLRHDGWNLGVERDDRAERWRLGVGFRDQLESPLATEATWTLFHRPLVVGPNLPAAFGRAREVAVSGGVRLPLLPLRLEADYWSAGPALGSDLVYDRARVALGGDASLGRLASLVPQLAWGVLHGNRVPQESFFLGAGPTLVSIPRDALAGSSFAIAKLDLVGAGDLLRTLRLPHPAMLDLRGALFAATAAAGGADPFGGPARLGADFPDRREWLSEAGISLRYDPGLFGITLKASEAWPLGATDRHERFQLVATHALDLLRRPRDDN